MADPEEISPDEPPAYDASDKAQVDKRKRDTGRRRKQAEEVIKHLMSTPGGRAWIWEKLTLAHIFTTSFTPGDPMATAFAEGERNFGLRLLADVMKAAPDLYLVAMKENGRGS